MDDVKSARPLRPGLHTCYNGGYSRPLPGDGTPILKAPLSSDWSLQPDSTKLDSLVIAHQPRRGTGRCGWNTSFLERFPKTVLSGRSVPIREASRLPSVCSSVVCKDIENPEAGPVRAGFGLTVL